MTEGANATKSSCIETPYPKQKNIDSNYSEMRFEKYTDRYNEAKKFMVV